MIEKINRDREPLKLNKEVHKGAELKLQFQVIKDGSIVDVSTWQFYFIAVEKTAGGDDVLTTNSIDSPAGIALDATLNNVVNVVFSDTDTAAITQNGKLYFQIDAITDTAERVRLWIGNLNIIEIA